MNNLLKIIKSDDMAIVSNAKFHGYKGSRPYLFEVLEITSSFIDFLGYKSIVELQNKTWLDVISISEHWKIEVLKKAKYQIQFGSLPNTWEIITKDYKKKYVTTDINNTNTNNRVSTIYHNISEATVEDWNISNLIWLRRLEDILHNVIIYND
jgi:hypothetical protein|tara:strand:+ start:482 stop:940 length:459 start_codon:yes stop_codon:yes gene_type:complete